MKRQLLAVLALTCLALASLGPVHRARAAGRVVVNYDDWTLTDTGFAPPNDAARYAQDIAAWFMAGGTGHFIAYDRAGDAHLNGSGFRSALSAAGHTLTNSTATTLSVAELQQYDGVFIGAWPLGHSPENVKALLAYVAMGGNVYVYGGTDFYGSIAADSVVLASFLNPFGLSVAGSVPGWSGEIPVNCEYPVLNGVAWLYAANGCSITDLDPGNPWVSVIATYDGWGVVGIADQVDPAGVDPTVARVDEGRVVVTPNPARATVTIGFGMRAGGRATVDVFDTSGRRVRRVLEADLPAGLHHVTWDGARTEGTTAPAGLYFVRVRTPAGRSFARLVRVE